MLTTMSCPNCRAALEYDPELHQVTIKCEYCSSTILVPEMLQTAGASAGSVPSAEDWEAIRGHLTHNRKIEAIKVLRQQTGLGLKEAKEIIDGLEGNAEVFIGRSDLKIDLTPAATARRAARSVAGCSLFFVLAGLVAAGVIFFVIMRDPFAGLGESGGEPLMEELSAVVATVEAGSGVTISLGEESGLASGASEQGSASSEQVSGSSGLAEVVLEFGQGEGVGPGFFNDTRWIALDPAGQIITADFSDGRVQIFDGAGAFRALWNSEIDYSGGFTVGPDGVVYIAQGWDVFRFDGESGEPLGRLNIEFRSLIKSLATGPDGSIYIYSPERLVRLSPQGEITADIQGLDENLADLDGPYGALTVDGAGNLYVLGEYAVFVLDREGRLLTRFGSRGDGVDQFRASPTALAVDGSGRIFVNSFDGIKVFDGDGRFLEVIPFRGVAFDMLVTPQNELLVMDRNNNRVVKYRLN